MAKIQPKQINAASSGGSLVTDVLSVTDLNNTISGLQGTPTGRLFMLFVNGVCYIPSVKNPPFTINGQTLIWSVNNSGFALEMADSLVAIYSSSTVLSTGVNSSQITMNS